MQVCKYTQGPARIELIQAMIWPWVKTFVYNLTHKSGNFSSVNIKTRLQVKLCDKLPKEETYNVTNYLKRNKLCDSNPINILCTGKEYGAH